MTRSERPAASITSPISNTRSPVSSRMDAACALCAALTGWTVYVNWDRIGVRLMVGFGFLILAGWGFKIAHGMLAGTLPVE